ncbi:hypothetical protein ACP70R_040106 [Stipagrostis hirtigluma subsp. patula]
MARAVELILVAIAVLAASLPVKCATTDDKATSEMDSYFKKAFDAISAAAPPEKKKEVEEAKFKHMFVATLVLNKAESSGDKKRVSEINAAFKKATDVIIAAPPADRLQVMEETYLEVEKSFA